MKKIVCNRNIMKESDMEPLFFAYRGNWYKGKAPLYYDSSEFKFTEEIEDKFEIIKKELIEYFNKPGLDIKTQYIPHEYTEEGWKVLNIRGYMSLSFSLLKHFPTLKNIMLKYPEIISMQISIIQPHSRIKAHFGGSNGLIRHHLGLKIPDTLPKVGMNIKGEKRNWEEGKIMSFCESHRHYVWNDTDESRAVLLFDTIHPQYSSKKFSIISGISSLMLMIFLLKHFKFLNKFSYQSEVLLHKSLSFVLKPFFVVREIIFRWILRYIL